MHSSENLPGGPQQQALLRQIQAYYQDDPRVLALIVFGSLGRGNWDTYSDLDLDLITANGVEIDARQETQRLCASLAAGGEEALLILPYEDEADVVFCSLLELSIRYHPLESTSPSILSSMRPLFSRIPVEAIHAAGLANSQPEHRPVEEIVARALRYTLEAAVAVQRQRRWMAVEIFHRLRGLLMELYAATRNGPDGSGYAYRFFQAEASAYLQSRLGATLPTFDRASMQAVHGLFCDILIHDLEPLSNNQIRLDAAQTAFLERTCRIIQ